MELQPSELMCLWDALANLVVHPRLAHSEEAEAFILTIADKLEKELARQGYQMVPEGEYYVVKQ